MQISQKLKNILSKQKNIDRNDTRPIKFYANFYHNHSEREALAQPPTHARTRM